MPSELAGRLLPDLYACCEDSRRWQPVLDNICNGLGVRNAVAQILRMNGPYLEERWSMRDSLSLSHSTQHDYWVNNSENPRMNMDNMDGMGRNHLCGSVVTDKQLFLPGSTHIKDLQQRLAKVGLRGGTSVHFQMTPNHAFSFLLHRSVDDIQGSEQKDVAFLREMAPHIQRVVDITARIETASSNSAMISAIAQHANVGALLCTRNGTVEWCNSLAEQMTQAPFPLRINNGQLQCLRREDQPRLNQLLCPLNEQQPESISLDSSSYGQRTMVRVMATSVSQMTTDKGTTDNAGMMGQSDNVILLLTNPLMASPISAREAAIYFGLTDAEARLSVALCEGVSVAEYARARGISEGTARIQLKRALAKTDSRRQAELVAKLYGAAQVAPALI